MHNGHSPKGLWVASAIAGGGLFDCSPSTKLIGEVVNTLHVGSYHLGQGVKDAPSLKEFNDEQYDMFARAGSSRVFKTEHIYYGEDSPFATYPEWEVMIGAVQGKIYKIQAQVTTTNFDGARQLKKETVKYINAAMGKYSKHANMFNSFIWDSPEGNIVLNLNKAEGMYALNATLTASFIKNLANGEKNE